MGYQDRLYEPGIEQVIWEDLDSLQNEETKCEKVAMCRYCNFTDIAEKEDRLFHCNILQSLHLGLTEGMFDVATFRQTIEKKKLADAETTHTSPLLSGATR